LNGCHGGWQQGHVMMNGRTIDIAPSILSADFSRLGEEIAAVERGGATILHVDVMDGHFVPNLTLGLPVVKSIAQATELPIDAHLMISEPGRYAQHFVEAGPKWFQCMLKRTRICIEP